MKTKKEVREYLRKARKKITKGLWGLYGTWQSGMPPQPRKGALEAAPGLTIGATGHTEPLARISGYGHDCKAHADYITVVVNHIEDLLDDIDELEEENAALLDIIKRMKEAKNIEG